MAAIEKETNYSSRDNSLENEPIFGVDHEDLFAAVRDGDTIKEYRLGAVFVGGEDPLDSMPVVNGTILGSGNSTPLGSMIEVVGVKATFEQYWTPASAVYALRRTSHEERRTRTGKLKEINITSDTALLGVMAPRNIDQSL